jgi:site-specific recombinase XerD
VFMLYCRMGGDIEE